MPGRDAEDRAPVLMKRFYPCGREAVERLPELPDPDPEPSPVEHGLDDPGSPPVPIDGGAPAPLEVACSP